MSDRGAELAALAALLADRTRAGICLALVDGRAWTAGELARHTGVAPSTATEHLDRLRDGGLVVEHRQGRHRYVRLAGPQVADLLEAMVAHLGPQVAPVTGLRTATVAAALARGRTCYDHLAGRLGVAVTDAMTARGLLRAEDGFALTESGSAWLTESMGIDPVALRATRRAIVRPCLDWTERRVHLGGAAGAQLCRRMIELAWLERVGSGRAVRVTASGEAGLSDALGIDADLLR
ncbi:MULTISPECIES: ArsR/SmtB family transcription factor [Nocardia]|uniref:Winged helix-turn-helix domain-containing protein n=1 Tax=Nocardia implantans TaxID=3108168 RepID=A0ABU6B1T0_9NOCA|nr:MULTISPECIES: winged helix-turn-helix domain-containing protein [unclassified Nocardia]MBF6195750.1 winged helix-turn-helix transcriptional regulator [Nocardia beijingensis]MEA3531164.1 winged helix-turn-helix domain-containing protein [Nocardia sp. CDC192]MEB3513626.1 winged helix-turn-helix domain-containing protein [Nocardia sp. CDC186]